MNNYAYFGGTYFSNNNYFPLFSIVNENDNSVTSFKFNKIDHFTVNIQNLEHLHANFLNESTNGDSNLPLFKVIGIMVPRDPTSFKVLQSIALGNKMRILMIDEYDRSLKTNQASYRISFFEYSLTQAGFPKVYSLSGARQLHIFGNWHNTNEAQFEGQLYSDTAQKQFRITLTNIFATDFDLSNNRMYSHPNGNI